MTSHDDQRRIFCIGRNYAMHAAELSNPVPEQPVIFMKPSSSIVRSGDTLYFPEHGKDLQHEVELVVQIDAMARILAVTVGVDLTLRDVQTELKSRGLPWELAKAFDHSALLGDLTPVSDDIDLAAITFHCSVNGEKRQSGNSADMLFPVEQLIAAIGNAWRPMDGDLIYTGTPAGVGSLAIGDRIRIGSDVTDDFEWQIAAPRRASDLSLGGDEAKDES